jgi:hypothetical protein
MRIPSKARLLVVVATAAVIATAGCDRQPDPVTQLGELEQTFGGSEAVQPEAAASHVTQDLPVEPDTDQAGTPQVFVNRAAAAVRAGEPAEGVMLLQSLQQMPGMNAQERMAVQKTIRAVTADLVRRAADGDAHAQAELKRIERCLSVR